MPVWWTTNLPDVIKPYAAQSVGMLFLSAILISYSLLNFVMYYFYLLYYVLFFHVLCSPANVEVLIRIILGARCTKCLTRARAMHARGVRNQTVICACSRLLSVRFLLISAFSRSYSLGGIHFHYNITSINNSPNFGSDFSTPDTCKCTKPIDIVVSMSSYPLLPL
jgi:hypothetical protein